MPSREKIVGCVFLMLMVCCLVDGNSQPVEWAQAMEDEFPREYWLDAPPRGIVIPRWENRFNEESKRRLGLLADNSKDDDSSDAMQQLKRLGNRKFQTQGWRRKRSHV